MKIGEVAAATGVSTRALRYYEQHGLLTATRTPGGQRDYTADTVERVQWIQSLFAAGLNSRTIRELLPCVHSGIVTTEMLERLIQQRDRIADQLRELSTTHDRLDALIVEATAPERNAGGRRSQMISSSGSARAALLS